MFRPFPADDPAFHLVGGQMDDGDRRLGRVVRGHSLHDGGEDPPRPLLPILERVALDVAHPMRGLGLGLLLDFADQRVARLGRRQAADLLERGQLLVAEGSQAGLLGLGLGDSLLGHCLPPVEGLGLAVENLGSVQQEALLALEIGPTLAGLFFGRPLGLEDLVLALEDDLLLLGSGVGYQSLGIRLGVSDLGGRPHPARDIPEDQAEDAGDHRNGDHGHGFRHGSSISGARSQVQACPAGARVNGLSNRWSESGPTIGGGYSTPTGQPGRLACSGRCDAAQQPDHVEVAGQEVLEHDPLDAALLETPDLLVGLVRGADDPAPAALRQPCLAVAGGVRSERRQLGADPLLELLLAYPRRAPRPWPTS